jgi:eukaryotic-like serine/threonine-protein kinase
LALEPISARSPTLRYRAAKFTQRHRAAVAVAVAVSMILVGAVVVTTQQLLEARRQRDRAQFESSRAEANSDFLATLMLSDLDAGRPPATLNERLELGVQLISRQYRDDPKFAGRMLVYLGAGFRDNEEIRRANELFEQAYALGSSERDAELMAYAQCSRAYGEAGAGIREGVAARIAEAQRVLQQARDADPTLEAGCLMALARFQRADDDAAAEATLHQAQRVLEADGSTQRQTYLSVLSELGQIYSSRGQPRELLRISQLIGETQDRTGRGGTSARVVSRQNAATALNSMGEPRAALAERIIINERLEAIEGQLPVRIVANYANVLLRMAQPDAAMRALDGVIERARQSGNPADVLLAVLTRSQACIELQRWDEVEAMLQEAGQMLADGTSSRNSRASLETQRARLALGRSDLPTARLHRDRALQLAGFETEKRESSLTRVLSVASRVALAENSAAELERFARAALALNEPNARGPDTSADVGEALLRLAQARGMQGNGEEMRSLLERAVRCLTNGMGEDHPLTLEARKLLAGR